MDQLPTGLLQTCGSCSTTFFARSRCVARLALSGALYLDVQLVCVNLTRTLVSALPSLSSFVFSSRSPWHALQDYGAVLFIEIFSRVRLAALLLHQHAAC